MKTNLHMLLTAGLITFFGLGCNDSELLLAKHDRDEARAHLVTCQRDGRKSRQELTDAQTRIAELLAERAKAAAPTHQPDASKVECNLDELKAANPGMVRDEEVGSRRAIASSSTQLQVFNKLLHLFDASKEPDGLAELPAEDGISLETVVPKLVAVNNGRGCELVMQNESKKTQALFHGAWSEFVGFAVHGFLQYSRSETGYSFDNETDPAGMARYVGQVSFMNLSPFGPASGWISDHFRQRLLEAAENEDQLRKLVEWGLPSAVQAIPEADQKAAAQWLKDYWKASHADFVALEREATRKDGKFIEPEGGRNRYLRENHLKREGFFLRRWMSRGRGKAGSDLIMVYRLGFAKSAVLLNMPEAAAWRAEVRTGLSNATTLKNKSTFISLL